jgi:hypothetical protein
MQHHPACARSASNLSAPATGRIMAAYQFWRSRQLLRLFAGENFGKQLVKVANAAV